MVESPHSFGKYTLLEKVAVGGMAEIYRAKTVGLGGFEKLLAIKRLHPQFGREHDVAQMLVDEARIAVHLTHPNIAQIFDLGCIDDQYFIAMEFIDGVDLHQVNKTVRERGSSIPVPALVFIMTEALSGLHYAHTRADADGKPLQIVHRDVSPQNIMVSHEGEVKLVDFGIAKAESRAQEETQHGIIKGKFYYMSPEQAYGHHIDARTDVFAAGMVLYELLAGKNPYAGIKEYELLKAVRKADIPDLSSVRPDISPQLVDIVMRATRRDANYRFESARAMQLALTDFLDRAGSYRRLDLAQFIGNVVGRGDEFGDDGAVMSRVDYEASESSMIFKPGASLARAIDAPSDFEDEENPFLDDEPTQLWAPSMPKPPSAPSPFAEVPAAAGPTDQANVPGFGATGSVPVPKRATTQSKLPLIERLVPPSLRKARVLLIGVTALVVVLGGVLAYLLAGGDTTSQAAAAKAAEQPAPSTVAPTNSAASADDTETVDVRIKSEPAGAHVFLDGEPRGPTPVVLQGLSTAGTHHLKLTRVGYKTFERTIQPSATTDTLDFQLEPSGAVLKVATYPPNATITVDGQERGRSPIDVAGLSRSDSHTVVAALDDDHKLERKVRWGDSDGRVKQVEFDFNHPEQGDDSAAAKPSAPPKTPARHSSPRRHRTRHHHTRHHRRSHSSALKVWGSGGSKASSHKKASSKGLDIWGNGAHQSAAKGVLAVRVNIPAKIYVNGKLVSGETTSINRSLAPGTYKVRVFFSRYKRYSSTRRIRIKSGQTSRTVFAP